MEICNKEESGPSYEHVLGRLYERVWDKYEVLSNERYSGPYMMTRHRAGTCDGFSTDKYVLVNLKTGDLWSNGDPWGAVGAAGWVDVTRKYCLVSKDKVKE